MTSFRPTFWPTVITAIGVIFLFVLGTWQVQRLTWKLDLIALTEARLEQPPVVLPGAGVDAETFNYRPTLAHGRFLHDREIHLIAHTRKGRFGYHVITPLQRADGTVVMVDRGWVPAKLKAASTRAPGQIEGVVTVRGIARKPWPRTAFVPQNDAAANQWFYGDLTAMAAQAGVIAAPVFIEADATANPGGWPLGGQTKVSFVNNHLQYAITWYALGLVLLLIYVLYHRQNHQNHQNHQNRRTEADML